MKFVCEHCNSKYNIADSKVRNKVLKIRCKKCNEIIVIRGPSVQKKKPPDSSPQKKKAGSPLEDRFAASFKSDSGQKAGGTPGLLSAVKKSAQRIEQGEADVPVWFIAIDNSPAGPITARDIRNHSREKKVTDASLVWKEGMPDWISLRHCKELVGLLARIDIEISLGGDRAAAPAPKEVEKPRLGLFVPEEKKEKVAESPLKGGSVGVLADRLDVPPPAAKDKAFDDFLSGDQALFPDDSSGIAALQSISPIRPAGPDRWVKFAAVGFFAVAVAVLGLIIAFGKGTVEMETVVEIKERVIERVVYKDRPDKETGIRIQDRPPQSDDKGSGSQSPRKGIGSGKYKGSGKSAPRGESAEERKKRLLAQMSGGPPVGSHDLVGGTSGKDSSGGSSSGAAALSSRQLSGVVNQNKGRLQICYENSLKQGEAPDDRDVKIMLRATVGGSGMVKKVSIGGAGAKLPGLKSCMERAVKKWVFPASSGESKIDFPFLFTPK